MKGSTTRKIIFWCIVAGCSIILFLRIENIIFNLIVLLVNIFGSLLLVLQKTPREEMQESIEKVTGIKYIQPGQDIQKVVNQLWEEEREERNGFLNKILKALGLKE